nr:ATP-binding protein [Schaalia vaccimaxillae]
MPATWMAGVCAGLAVHLGVKVSWVRIGLIVLTIMTLGLGVLLYLWLWVMVPKDGAQTETTIGRGISSGLQAVRQDRRASTSRNQLLISGILMLAVSFMAIVLANAGVVEVRDVLSMVMVVAGIGLIWSQSGDKAQWGNGKFLAMVSAGATLMIIGIVMIFGRNDPPIILLRGGLIGSAVVAGALFAFAPLWLRTNKDLTAAKEQQVRDAERADIAAHLHDSVLQTLTLIRASADDPTRVRAIALSEERELRSWLYTGHEEAADSLAQLVSEAAGQIESRYGIPVDVVTVGDFKPGPEEMALVAALSEAAANAVRHGKPPVSVYVEARSTVTEAFIKDAGTGFDLDSIPADRHGVRDSIIGRMERSGGTATITKRAGGTEVALVMPRTPESSN